MDHSSDTDSAGNLFKSHERDFRANHYVYPVLSRRAGGISIGVNLSPSKACNFGCVYCQVDRDASPQGKPEPIDLDRLAVELDTMLDLVVSGRLFRETKFRNTPESLRRLNDIALSGDGEPTLCARFEEAVTVAARALRQHSLGNVKLVLITNATCCINHVSGRRCGYLTRQMARYGRNSMPAQSSTIVRLLEHRFPGNKS